ncbi:hypothetical protein Bca101_031909 [Brassica carinata]
MGLLAGSTVTLLSIIWRTCKVVGKCNIRDTIAVNNQDTRTFHLKDSGVSVDVWTMCLFIVNAVVEFVWVDELQGVMPVIMPLPLLPPNLAAHKMIINLGGKFHEMIQYNPFLIMLSRASNTDLTHCYFPVVSGSDVLCALVLYGSGALRLNLNNSTSHAVGGVQVNKKCSKCRWLLSHQHTSTKK